MSAAVVVASLPQACEVCGSKGQVWLSPVYAVFGADIEHGAAWPCLHCDWGIPVVCVPVLPRSAR